MKPQALDMTGDQFTRHVNLEKQLICPVCRGIDLTHIDSFCKGATLRTDLWHCGECDSKFEPMFHIYDYKLVQRRGKK